MIDVERWAIKNGDHNVLIGNKEGRTLWKRKPTKAIETIEWRASLHRINLDLVPVKVRITEVEQ
jgi:hypothetical protein